jgi:hypothetical protein
VNSGPCFNEAVRWTDVFTVISRKQLGQNWKTTKADQITWSGIFERLPVRVVSTVRLTFGNLAHFTINSGARIGAHDWNLPGGHYIDLRVQCAQPLDDVQLLRLGQMAASEENRPIRVRRWKERLCDGISVAL